MAGLLGTLVYSVGLLQRFDLLYGQCRIVPDALKNLIPKELSPEDLEDPFVGDASEIPRWDNRGSSGLNNFDANKHPDKTNYEFLLDLYGATELRQERHLKKRQR
jgi:hypothetical protein